MFILENSGVYKIVNKLNGKYYPGSSKNLLKQKGDRGRKREHFDMLQKGIHHCHHLQHAYDLYGEENFEFIIIKNNIPINELLAAEQKLLAIARTEPEMCYTRNYLAGRLEMTQEIKDKISKANTGKIRSEECKRKMSIWASKQRHTSETKEKIRQANLGHIMSPYNRQRLSEARKLQDMSYCRDKIQQIDKNTSEVIKVWDSISDAAKQFLKKNGKLCSHVSNIASVCKKKLCRKSAYGFKWEYV